VSDVLFVAVALVVGGGLGLFYFGGLWLTLQRLPRLKHPAALALASFFGRTVIVVLVIFLVARDSWQRIAACLVGFLAVRGLMIHRLRPPRKTAQAETEQGAAPVAEEGNG